MLLFKSTMDQTNVAPTTISNNKNHWNSKSSKSELCNGWERIFSKLNSTCRISCLRWIWTLNIFLKEKCQVCALSHLFIKYPFVDKYYKISRSLAPHSIITARCRRSNSMDSKNSYRCVAGMCVYFISLKMFISIPT